MNVVNTCQPGLGPQECNTNLKMATQSLRLEIERLTLVVNTKGGPHGKEKQRYKNRIAYLTKTVTLLELSWSATG